MTALSPFCSPEVLISWSKPIDWTFQFVYKSFEWLGAEIETLIPLHVTNLILDYNNIGVLPPQISLLENLTQLSLLKNSLNEIPEVLARLTNLRFEFSNFYFSNLI